MRQKKKIRLKDSVKRRYVEFGTRNLAWSGEMDLLESLFD